MNADSIYFTNYNLNRENYIGKASLFFSTCILVFLIIETPKIKESLK
jgi:hypothetical protein